MLIRNYLGNSLAKLPGSIVQGSGAVLGLTLAVAMMLIAPGPARAGGTVELEFNPANFSDPLDIDNTYFPLDPDTIFTYMAEGEDGCEWDVTTVTDEVHAVAAGVTARVVRDAAYEDEDCGGIDSSELVEITDDWFAQDDAGNVWYLGEDSQDCEGAGNCSPSEGSWEAGADIAGSGQNAEGGIIMLADPGPGEQYYQEFYEDFAEDQAKVLRSNVWLSLYNSDVFDHDLHNCLVTKEWTKLEPGEIENKFYCPGVGLAVIKELKGKTLRFELVGLSPEP
jgi:hypothetical protein